MTSPTQTQGSFAYWIDSLQINGGDEIQLPRSGVLAIVGANNVGKSTLLRQILAATQSPNREAPPNPRILTHLRTSHAGTSEDLIQWLRDAGHVTMSEFGERLDNGQEIQSAYWMLQHPETQDYCSPYYVHMTPVEVRASLAQPIEAQADLSQPSTQPMHILRSNPERLSKLKSVIKRIFGLSLTLDPISRLVGLRVGSPSASPPLLDQAAGEYGRELATLPWISDQGDGVKNAFGIVLSALANPPFVLLLDEPEAFLHPPQAREMGRQLASIAHQEKLQIIVATHDKHLLTGLMDVAEADIAVLHLKRDGDESSANILPATRIQELRTDPLLRFSDALDGLFHHAVVLVENPQDALFYAATLDGMDETDKKPEASNLQFLATYGKGNIPKVAALLGDLNVRVICSPDLDILDDTGTFKSLLRSMNVGWDSVKTDYLDATEEFRTGRNSPQRAWAREKLINIVDSSSDAELRQDEIKSLEEIIKSNSAWKALQDYGEAAFRNDPAAAGRLLDLLDAARIVIVRVGDLEKFLKTKKVPKGPTWIGEALAESAHKTEEAREHVRRILASAGALSE